MDPVTRCESCGQFKTADESPYCSECWDEIDAEEARRIEGTWA
jgi:hypothetical protein